MNTIVKNKTATYYFCLCDGYGQRTGEVRSITLRNSEIKVDGYGMLHHGGRFLFTDKSEATGAALS